MKVNLQKESLNDKLKTNYAPVRVVEERDNYLVFKFSDKERDAFVFMVSFIISSGVTPTLFFKLPKSLQDKILEIFDIFIDIFSLPKQGSCFNMICVIGLGGLVVSYLIYLFLAKVFYFFFELRFIGDRLIIAKKDGNKEIVLDDDVKFSIEEGPAYKGGPIYKLNISYHYDFEYKTICLFSFGNSTVADLILERINKYLEQNKKSQSENNNDRAY
ncbi:hypothetical protein IJJ97_00630 [bacterium]|nr:hypothetical protein [bacterium]